MKDLIVLKRMLEGLIHNLNNPLNLIMGYSQQIRQKQPDSLEARKIYEAGIQIDDMLKQLSQKLWDNSIDEPVNLRLGFWLQGELSYLKHYLPLKHSLVINRKDLTEEMVVAASPYRLSVWYESLLIHLFEKGGNQKLDSGIALYNGQAALYLKIEKASAERAEIGTLIQDLAGLKPYIQSIWQPDELCVYGVIYEK